VCGIVGLLIKRIELRQQLGTLICPMISCMGTRGPDSAGLAVFQEPLPSGQRRFAMFSADADFDWAELERRFVADTETPCQVDAVERHASLVSTIPVEAFTNWLRGAQPDLHLLSVGRSIDVYKDEGHPRDIADRYQFARMSGTHAVAHTRMATESSVSPQHAHPFTAGQDFCLVHNGSLSNPYSIRRTLEKRGIEFETDNDTEAGCRYLEWRMREGDGLEQAIQHAFSALDGFFTFLMATGERMVLVRDAFACKPAVVAETDDYVAVGSEFRSLAHLPEIASARVYEPQPEQIYSWTV